KVLMTLFPGMPGSLVLALSVVAAVMVCVPLSLIIERVAYRPLRNAPRLAPLITAIGVSLTLQTIVMGFFGRNYHEFPSLVPQEPIEFHGLVISVTQIIILVLSLVCMVCLALLIEKTQVGRMMRATSENPKVAALLGIDTNKVVLLAFGIGAGLAG